MKSAIGIFTFNKAMWLVNDSLSTMSHESKIVFLKIVKSSLLLRNSLPCYNLMQNRIKKRQTANMLKDIFVDSVNIESD